MGIFDGFFGKKEKKIIFNNETLKNAVQEWLENSSKAERKYGHISKWNVSNVTDMYGLFRGLKSFNDDISNWNVSNVTDMCEMFLGQLLLIKILAIGM
jgi:surface protein